jgi:hypothetical protein
LHVWSAAEFAEERVFEVAGSGKFYVLGDNRVPLGMCDMLGTRTHDGPVHPYTSGFISTSGY